MAAKVVNPHPTRLLFLALIACSSPAAAQVRIGPPLPSALLSSDTPGPLRTAGLAVPPDSIDRDIRPTYWKEGALVGGLVGAAGGAVLGAAICRNSEEFGKRCTGTAVASGLISGLVLAIPGALIGGQIHKGGATE